MVIEQTYNWGLANGDITLGLHGPDEKTPKTVLLSVGPDGCSTLFHMELTDFIKFAGQVNRMMDTIDKLVMKSEVA